MSILSFIITLVVAVLIVNTILSLVYKNKEKKDQGFVLTYHRLTYRRRFIRALWGVPIVALLYVVLYLLSDLTSTEYTFIGVIFVASVLLDIGYNYAKWKNLEKEI